MNFRCRTTVSTISASMQARDPAHRWPENQLAARLAGQRIDSTPSRQPQDPGQTFPVCPGILPGTEEQKHQSVQSRSGRRQKAEVGDGNGRRPSSRTHQANALPPRSRAQLWRPGGISKARHSRRSGRRRNRCPMDNEAPIARDASVPSLGFPRFFPRAGSCPATVAGY